MPIDPCGMIMDFARSSTKHDAIIFRDDSRPITIRWYNAPPGAKVFPTRHKWGHLSWYTSPWEATGVGEVYDSPDRWSNGFTPPTATGQSYFGALADFQEGPLFDGSVNVPRDDWGLAIACPGCCKDSILLETSLPYITMTEDGKCIALETSAPCLYP